MTSASPDRPALVAAATSRHLALAGLILATLIPMAVAGFRARWQHDPLVDFLSQRGGWPVVALIAAASAPVHELLHVLGWRLFGRQLYSSVSWTLTWRGLGIAARLETPIAMAAYRGATVLPTLVLGVGVVAAGLQLGRGVVFCWGLFFAFEGISDLALLLASRRIPGHARVLVDPRRLGLVVIAE